VPDDIGGSLISTAAAKAVETGVTETFKLLHTLLDAPLAETGDYLKEIISDRRKARREKLLTGVLERACDANFAPHAVLDKIALPLFEAAMLEDDPSLQELWTNLLANAADPRQRIAVGGQYISILRELGPTDAAFFQIYAAECEQKRGGTVDALSIAASKSGIAKFEPGTVGPYGGYESAADQELGLRNIQLTVDSLCRAGVMARISQVDAIDRRQIEDWIQRFKDRRSGRLKIDMPPRLTELGRAFYRAVQPPITGS